MNENEIQVWNYESSEIRTVQVNGEPWFVLADVCKVLELSTPARVAERLEKDEVSQTHTIDRMGREQKNNHHQRIRFIHRDSPERQATSKTVPEMGHLRSPSIHPQARQLFRAVAVCGFIPTAAGLNPNGNTAETDRSPSGRAGNRTCRTGTEDSEHLRGHRSGQDRMEKRQRTPD